ncbi:hypothetical protein [Corallincola holothuriorum]|uniref:hypothetical protein n=1 Tax=Corallincola holothuriorum TaxID=2282215 RepID=UPI0018F23814|nr:hypothetical protein [Corallincola holothuriorum]
MKFVAPLVACLLLFGCSDETTQQPFEQACTDPRPQICTMDYNPVDGYLETGEWKSFSNACNACSHPQVLGYKEPDENSEQQKVSPP